MPSVQTPPCASLLFCIHHTACSYECRCMHVCPRASVFAPCGGSSKLFNVTNLIPPASRLMAPYCPEPAGLLYSTVQFKSFVFCVLCHPRVEVSRKTFFFIFFKSLLIVTRASLVWCVRILSHKINSAAVSNNCQLLYKL